MDVDQASRPFDDSIIEMTQVAEKVTAFACPVPSHICVCVCFVITTFGIFLLRDFYFLQETSRGRTSKTEMEELMKKFCDNDLIPPKGLSFKRLQERLQNELKKKNQIHSELSSLSLKDLRTLYEKTIGTIPSHSYKRANRLRKNIASFYIENCQNISPSTFFKDAGLVDPIEANQSGKFLTSKEMSDENTDTEMYQKTTSSLSHQIDLIKDPQVVEESLEDFVATIPSATLDDYYNILNHDIIPEQMTDEEKRMAILHLSKECFQDGALGFLKECQVQSLSAENFDDDCQMSEVAEVS